MNLNYETSKTEFMAFVASADRQLDMHSIAIDFDGEVIIDAEKHYPNIPADRYKFYTCVRDISLRKIDTLLALYRSLRLIFDEGIPYNAEQKIRLAA